MSLMKPTLNRTGWDGRRVPQDRMAEGPSGGLRPWLNATKSSGVIIWSMGNEAGDGINSKRPADDQTARSVTEIHYEQAGRSQPDIVCPMYASIDHIVRYASQSRRVPDSVRICHAMGNASGNLQDYWDAIERYGICKAAVSGIGSIRGFARKS